MGLNKSKGNMYEFVTHTWNTIKGECHHDCSYCYMKRWGKPNPVRFDEKELKTDLGAGNFIFVGSSCDMWANDVLREWIEKTLKYCAEFGNQYLFQTKNPGRMMGFTLPRSVICTTIESDFYYRDIMGNSPAPYTRAKHMGMLSKLGFETFVTIEPIMDFDLKGMLELIEMCDPWQVNIGADSGGHKLPEPDRDKVLKLIEQLKFITNVHQKPNLNRLLK